MARIAATSRIRPLFVALLALLSLAAAGAVTAAPTAGTGPQRTAATPLTKITYSTGFGFVGRDAFIYVCIELGYCRAEGFEVTVVPGTGTLDVAKAIAVGRVDYGIGDYTAMVVARAQEKLPVKGIYVREQQTPSAILSLEKTGIRTPKDLEGKTFADSPASTVKVLFNLYAKRAGIDASKVRFIPAAPPQLPALLASGQVDSIGQFSLGLPLFAKVARQPVVALRYSRYFPGLMGGVIMASDSTLSQKGQQTRRFLRAIDKSIRYTLDNPGQTGRILNKYQPTADYEVAAKEVRLQRPFIRTPETLKMGFGYINPKRVDAMISVVVNGFQVRERVTRDDVMDGRFLPGPPKQPKR